FYSFICILTPPATTLPCTLSLHDALPILKPTPASRCPLIQAKLQSSCRQHNQFSNKSPRLSNNTPSSSNIPFICSNKIKPLLPRSEEHTSELQSREKLVCRLLLEKKKKQE